MFILSKGKPKTVNLLADRPNRQAGCKVSGGQRELDDTIKQKVGNREGRSIKKYGVRQNVWTYDTGFNNFLVLHVLLNQTAEALIETSARLTVD